MDNEYRITFSYQFCLVGETEKEVLDLAKDMLCNVKEDDFIVDIVKTH